MSSSVPGTPASLSAAHSALRVSLMTTALHFTVACSPILRATYDDQFPTSLKMTASSGVNVRVTDLMIGVTGLGTTRSTVTSMLLPPILPKVPPSLDLTPLEPDQAPYLPVRDLLPPHKLIDVSRGDIQPF